MLLVAVEAVRAALLVPLVVLQVITKEENCKAESRFSSMLPFQHFLSNCGCVELYLLNSIRKACMTRFMKYQVPGP